MAVAYTDLPAVKFGFIKENDPNTHQTITPGQSYPVGGYVSNGNRTALLIGFDAFPAALKRNKLYGGQITAYASKFERGGSPVSTNWYASCGIAVVDDFDAAAVTWGNYPAYTDGYSTFYDFLGFTKAAPEVSAPETSKLTGGSGTPDFLSRKIDILRKRTVRLAQYSSSYADEFVFVSTKLQDGTSLPFLRVYYDDAEVETSQVHKGYGPSGGSYADPREAIRFTWYLWQATSLRVYDDTFVQASAVFHWKPAGGSYTAVNISGSTTEVTIPANTFPSATTITYYIEATDTDGTTTTTEEFTFSTEDGAAYATPIEPIDSVQDGSRQISFRWSLSSDSGTTPTRVELQWNNAGTWTTLMDEASAVSHYTAPAGTFPGGTVEWRVRAYNADSTAGDWGTASFVSIAAPAAPESIVTDGVPFLTVQWAATGQQAFEVVVDGVGQGPRFGTDKSFTLDEPLEDGEHLIGVRVQGSFGLWSAVAEVPVTIQNVPGSAVTLNGDLGIDASLFWSTASTAADFLIFRDGVRIGHTTATSFVDRLSVGTHEWTVLNRLPDGNYTRSNAVSGTLQTETTVIAAFGSDDWIELRLTENRQTVQNYTYDRQHSLRHVSGAAWPVLELSPFEDISAGFDTAFLAGADAKRFEALRGRVVTIKTRDDTLVVGALTSIRKTVGDFYTTYSFTLQRIHWEDFVDDNA